MNTVFSRRRFLAAAAGYAALVAFPALSFADTRSLVIVNKDPNCGCCTAWADHLSASGFTTRLVDNDNIYALKEQVGVPAALHSCHTAEVEGYVLEGHVPASAIERLLRERPNAAGLAVAGMPSGSPGMDYPGAPLEPYEVVQFGASGEQLFARYRGLQELWGSPEVAPAPRRQRMSAIRRAVAAP
ncbi:DUF411 domain-containing protein [Devosia sp. RR2S18]|uniref:DUF411 domain-containing protein n=1 Tax=Devosia rhizosphaerae TaxID=3049774 RepID=UPI0025400550|nr:DUF411 domain-containing protein [Devosia sp. RR2S18]WIJ26987.1 DUF411 domain-containing protein [Devosia sp. RR2S18]